MDFNLMKGPVDFSSFILFEATGDSEVDCQPFIDDDDDDDDDDDALSCTYDESYTCNAAELKGYDESCDAGDEHDCEKKKLDGISSCEDDDDDDDDDIHEEHHKSFDSTQDSLDEREKNRQFWEACLAS